MSSARGPLLPTPYIFKQGYYKRGPAVLYKDPRDRPYGPESIKKLKQLRNLQPLDQIVIIKFHLLLKFSKCYISVS